MKTFVAIVLIILVGIPLLGLTLFYLVQRRLKKRGAKDITPSPTEPSAPASTPTPAATARAGLGSIIEAFISVAGLALVVLIIGALGKACLQEYRLAMAQQQKHRVEQRRKLYPRTQVDFLYNQGNEYRRQKDYDRAIECYTKVLKINQEDVEAYNNLGVAYAGKGAYELAIKSYKQALRIDPQKANSWYNLGLNCERLGRIKEATEAYENFIKYASPKYASFIPEVRDRIQRLNQRLSQPIQKIPPPEEPENKEREEVAAPVEPLTLEVSHQIVVTQAPEETPNIPSVSTGVRAVTTVGLIVTAICAISGVLFVLLTRKYLRRTAS